MRIAVIGARGQLGASMVHEARTREHEVVPFDRSMLDIEDDGAVRAAMERTQPDAIINCAGYNNVDAAESLAKRIWQRLKARQETRARSA